MRPPISLFVPLLLLILHESGRASLYLDSKRTTFPKVGLRASVREAKANLQLYGKRTGGHKKKNKGSKFRKYRRKPRRKKPHFQAIGFPPTSDIEVGDASGTDPSNEAGANEEGPDGDEPAANSHRYIICFRESLSATSTDVEDMATALCSAFGKNPVHVYTNAIQGFSVHLTTDEHRALTSNSTIMSGIHRIEKDYEVQVLQSFLPFPAIELAVQQTDFPPPGLERIGVRENTIRVVKSGPNVAVLDTGVDVDHKDLNVVHCKSFIGSEAEENACDDVYGHGTHVAGIIGGKRTGVAPGVGIWAVKVLGDNGLGLISDIVKGVDYVLSNSEGVDIINLSFGGFGGTSKCDKNCKCDDSLRQSVCKAVDKGVVVVVAAGNNGKDAALDIPANYDEAITVSAMVDTDGLPGGMGISTAQGPDDEFASFSNYGNVVDIAAPGVEVLSTKSGGGYRVLSGTSMAAPHVAGAAILFINKNGLEKGSAGVAAVKKGLIDLGFRQAGKNGFKGDKDQNREPLVRVDKL